MSLQSELRRLYDEENGARDFFDVLASYTNRMGTTSAETMEGYSGLSYERVSALMKELDRLKLGEFKIGRHGRKTRMIWKFSPRSIGELAQGVGRELESYDGSEASEEDEKPVLEVRARPSMASQALSGNSYAEIIGSAKQLLAERLGIAAEQIEITIKH